VAVTRIVKGRTNGENTHPGEVKVTHNRLAERQDGIKEKTTKRRGQRFL